MPPPPHRVVAFYCSVFFTTARSLPFFVPTLIGFAYALEGHRQRVAFDGYNFVCIKIQSISIRPAIMHCPCSSFCNAAAAAAAAFSFFVIDFW